MTHFRFHSPAGHGAQIRRVGIVFKPAIADYWRSIYIIHAMDAPGKCEPIKNRVVCSRNTVILFLSIHHGFMLLPIPFLSDLFHTGEAAIQRNSRFHDHRAIVDTCRQPHLSAALFICKIDGLLRAQKQIPERPSGVVTVLFAFT